MRKLEERKSGNGQYAVYARKRKDENASLELRGDCLTYLEAIDLQGNLQKRGYVAITVASLKGR